MFNYYPLRVTKFKHKNASNEVDKCLNSGVHGIVNEKGDYIPPKKTDEYLTKLLAIVSDKINERFQSIKQCFRYLDMNHSQTITINEFARAMDQLRIKISFDDVKMLFNYLDKSKSGEIGYEEFTLLLEERWRGIDPVDLKLKSSNHIYPKRKVFSLNIYGDEKKVPEKIHILEHKSNSNSSLIQEPTEKITQVWPDVAVDRSH